MSRTLTLFDTFLQQKSAFFLETINLAGKSKKHQKLNIKQKLQDFKYNGFKESRSTASHIFIHKNCFQWKLSIVEKVRDVHQTLIRPHSSITRKFRGLTKMLREYIYFLGGGGLKISFFLLIYEWGLSSSYRVYTFTFTSTL